MFSLKPLSFVGKSLGLFPTPFDEGFFFSPWKQLFFSSECYTLQRPLVDCLFPFLNTDKQDFKVAASAMFIRSQDKKNNWEGKGRTLENNFNNPENLANLVSSCVDCGRGDSDVRWRGKKNPPRRRFKRFSILTAFWWNHRGLKPDAIAEPHLCMHGVAHPHQEQLRPETQDKVTQARCLTVTGLHTYHLAVLLLMLLNIIIK